MTQRSNFSSDFSNIQILIRSWVYGYLVIPILAKGSKRKSVANASENAGYSLVVK